MTASRRRLGTLAGRAGCTAALAAAAWVGAPGADPARAAGFERLEARVATPDHPEPRPLRVYREDGLDYFEVEEIAFLVRADRVWRADEGRMELSIAERRIRIEAGSPFVGIDETTRNLLAPAAWSGGRLLAPLALLTEILDPLVPGEISWDPEALLLRIDSSEPNLTGIAYAEEDGGTTIVIRTSRELPARIEEKFSRPPRLVAVVPGGVLDPDLVGSFPGRGLVESLSTSQSPDLATLTFRLRPEARSLEAAGHTSPTRIRLHVLPEEAEPDPADSADSLAVDPSATDELPAVEPWLGPARVVQRVVLDPGHGGSDGGGTSPRGEREKELALELARRVRDELHARAPEIEVRLTREDDRYLANEDRRRFANQVRADVFVSLHCDGWFDAKRRGFAVATWGNPSVDSDRALPSSAVIVGRVRRDVDLLADAVLGEVDRALTMPSRGVRAEPLDVLDGLRMPAILVECGTLTNSEDRKLLVGDGFQERLAGAIAEGILEFRRRLGPPPLAPTGGEAAPDEEDGG